MVLQVPGVAVRIATAIPGLEAHLAYAISSSDQTRADPHVRQTTTARWVSLAPMELTWALPVDVTLLAFLFRLVVRIISGPVEGGRFRAMPISAGDIGEGVRLVECWEEREEGGQMIEIEKLFP